MILRKISGSRNAWAWFTEWATESSQSERIGRIRGPWVQRRGRGLRGWLGGFRGRGGRLEGGSWRPILAHLGPPGWAILASCGASSASKPTSSEGRAGSIAPEQAVAAGQPLAGIGEGPQPCAGAAPEARPEQRPKLGNEAVVSPRVPHDVEGSDCPGLARVVRRASQPQSQGRALDVEAAKAGPDIVEPVPDLSHDRFAGSMASSGSACQPPIAAIATRALCLFRCSRSRGRSAPGECSRNATSCSPSAAATRAHASRLVPAPSPRSR